MTRTVASWGIATLLFSAGAIGAGGGAERFRGHVIDTQQVVPGAAATFFTLQVDRWGTEEEAKALLAILKEKGQQGLQKAFSDTRDAGFIRIGSQLGYSIAFARSIDTPEGRTIRAFTDRPIQFFELRNSLRSVDYPLGIVELKLDSSGKGEGVLLAAASAKFGDQGQLEIENLGTQPFKVVSIKTEPVKEKK